MSSRTTSSEGDRNTGRQISAGIQRATSKVRAGRPRGFGPKLTAFLFLLPALAVYLIFLVYPMISSLITSFTTWDGLSDEREFVGLANYKDIFFEDQVSQLSLLNNLIWMVATVLVPTILGLLLAVALNQSIRGRIILRSIFYAPAVLPLVALGLIWGWIYHPNFGILNETLRATGLESLSHNWLGDTKTALGATIVTGIWQRTGFAMLLYLAGLQAIPQAQYEAASIDGANAFKRFRYVTLPGLRTTHIIVIALSVIEAVKVFDLIYTMTYGGPGNSTQVLGTWMYFNTFQYANAGYGSAIAWIIAAISILIAIPYIRITSRRSPR